MRRIRLVPEALAEQVRQCGGMLTIQVQPYVLG